MVATKVLISLCALGLARAAPQLGVPLSFAPTSGVGVATNQNAIVTNVVTALQPQIADAVARALASLSSSSTFTTSTSSNSGSSGFNAGFNSGATGSVSGSVVAQEEVTARPNYNYEFKVADDDEQTYITHNEARDGDDVTGTYSYIDPTGALITVNYQAGVMGYTQTVDRQEGAVQIRSKAGSSSSSSVAATGGATSAAFGSGFSSSNRGSSSSTSSTSNSVNSVSSNSVNSVSSGLDQSALITQIITALQPQIASAVNSAVSSQQQTTVTRTVTSNNSGAVGDRFTPLFGN